VNEEALAHGGGGFAKNKQKYFNHSSEGDLIPTLVLELYPFVLKKIPEDGNPVPKYVGV